MAAKLTALKVKSAGAGLHGDGGGLYLQVTPPAARSWVFRFRSPIDKRDRYLGLGSVRDVSLVEARDLAIAARKTIREGRDPAAERRQERQGVHAASDPSPTFRAVTDLVIAAHEAGWRNEKHRKQWRSTLDLACSVFGDRPVAEISGRDVLAVLEPMWLSTPETASRLRGRIEATLDYAMARGLRSGENPARWKGHLENLLPAATKVRRVTHHAALPWRELGAFVVQLRSQAGASARALEFTIATAARTSEALGARWSEVSFEEKLWRIPGERMKGGMEHHVPLSATALDVLSRMKAAALTGSYVFPGQREERPLSSMALLMTLRRMKRAEITAHGFRSTFRDWAAEATDFPREVAEAALAHTVRDRVEAAYRRSSLIEKRRLLMERWSEQMSGLPAPREKPAA